MTEDSITRLLQRVGQRLRINSLLKRFQLWLFISATIYTLLLLFSRLLALIPDIFPIYSIGIPIFSGLLVALIWPCKINLIDSARAIDTQNNTDDLFLTASTLNTAKGEFQSLVKVQAEKEAAKTDVTKVVPIIWQTPLKNTILILLLLGVAVFVPKLDPFGKEKERVEQKKQDKVFVEARKETDKRLDKLKKESQEPKDTDNVKIELTKIFKEMKRHTPKKNADKLRQKRREIARLWTEKQQQLKSEKKGLQISSQKFGFNSNELKKIAKDLKNGQTSSAAKKLQELMKETEELAKMADSEEKTKKANQLKRQIQDMKDLLNDNLGNESVKAALNRALNQMANLSEESKQALEDAAKSLKLSERELSRLQKLMDESDELQKLMQTASQAQQSAQNNQGQQSGQQTQTPPEYDSFQEYEEYFNQQNGPQQQQGQQAMCNACQGTGKCASCNGSGKTEDGLACFDCKGSGRCKECKGKGTQGNCTACNGTGQGDAGGQCQGCSGTGQGQSTAGQGNGKGTGSPGEGGGSPGENDSTKTDFKKEVAKSQNQAGKILMEWKTKGVSEKGKVTVEYTEAMKKIREGVDEAISKEKIPPGYHDVIKKYFSSEEDQTLEKK